MVVVGAEVLQVDQRFSTRAMNQIFDALLASRPLDAVNETAISRESPLGRDDCPRVEIALLPPGQAAEASEAWASEMQERWGPDRVATRRSRLELRGGLGVKSPLTTPLPHAAAGAAGTDDSALLNAELNSPAQLERDPLRQARLSLRNPVCPEESLS